MPAQLLQVALSQRTPEKVADEIHRRLDEFRLGVACACRVQDAYAIYRAIRPLVGELEELTTAALARADYLNGDES